MRFQRFTLYRRYVVNTFRIKIAGSFVAQIYFQLQNFEHQYLMYPAYVHYGTKSKKYRNIIL